MPYIITPPGTRDGADNIFAEQYLPTSIEIGEGVRAYSSLFRLYWTDHSGASLVNRGTIWNISPYNVSVSVGGYNLDAVDNFGLIVAEAPVGNAYAVSVSSWGSRVDNWGQIFAIAGGNATALTHWSPDVRITNGGLVAAYAPTGNDAGTGGAVGIAMYNGGYLNNLLGASILAEGRTATALIYSRGEPFDRGVAEIRNAGLIEAYAIDPASESVAINTAALTVEYMRVENSGIIRADIAYIATSEYGYSPPQQPSDRIYNLAGGQIYGRIETRLGADQLINAGYIQGGILMGEGADLVDTTAGQVDGLVQLEWGEDRFLGSGGDDEVTGGRDADWIEGRDGQDLLLGGLGDDMLAGGAGNDGLFGEHGNDLIVVGGGDVVDGGAGDDRIEIGDLGFRSVSGGAGIDRLVLRVGPDSFDVASVRATGRVADIEIIEMAGDQRLVIRAGDPAGLNSESRLRLVTTASDRVELIGAWREDGSVLADGHFYRRFVLGAETALVAGDGAVIVATTPSAPAGGLDAIASGPVAPLPGAVPGANLSSTTTVLNNYSLHATETVQAHEVWRSDGGQPILWTFVWDYSLINHGLMESVGPGNGGAKVVYIGQIDRVENYGTMRAIGTGAEYADVIYATSFGGLTNYGLIEAVTESGVATGARIMGALRDEVNFLNLGTISARTNGAAQAIGAAVFRDDSAINYGTISAVGGNDSRGVLVAEQRMFTNHGTIIAALASGASGSTTGLFFGANALGFTLVNHGVIRGDRAIDSGTTFGGPGLLYLYNFDRLEGSLNLGDGHSKSENWGLVTAAAALGSGTDLWYGAGGENRGAVFGGDGADLLVGSAAADVLNGETGRDYIRGGTGADILSGGADADLFVYTALDESTGAAFDSITDFTSGVDRIDLTALDVSSVTLSAGDGFTQLLATTASGVLSVRVNGTLAQSDLLLSRTQTVDGTSGADVLHATAGGSTLRGSAGDDILVGSAGDDRLEPGAGADVAWGGAGNDVYLLTDGSDLVWEVTGEGTDRIDLQIAGALFFVPDNVENVTMFEAGFVRGNRLDNHILGSGGNDNITGGAGHDWIEGGAGDDFLEGGSGADTLIGGGGSDTFVFRVPTDSTDYARRSDATKLVPDLIADFISGVDKINLRDLRFQEGGEAIFPQFSFIGSAAFSHRVGEVRFESVSGLVHVYVDVNGDAAPDMHILVATEYLVAKDFIV